MVWKYCFYAIAYWLAWTLTQDMTKLQYVEMLSGKRKQSWCLQKYIGFVLIFHAQRNSKQTIRWQCQTFLRATYIYHSKRNWIIRSRLMLIHILCEFRRVICTFSHLFLIDLKSSYASIGFLKPHSCSKITLHRLVE